MATKTKVTKKKLEKMSNKVINKNVGKILFRNHEWLAHTTDQVTQNALSGFLNSKAWNGQTETMLYKGEEKTCFPILSLEMILWLKNNQSIHPSEIFHREKSFASRALRPWEKLKDTTKVK